MSRDGTVFAVDVAAYHAHVCAHVPNRACRRHQVLCSCACLWSCLCCTKRLPRVVKRAHAHHTPHTHTHTHTTHTHTHTRSARKSRRHRPRSLKCSLRAVCLPSAWPRLSVPATSIGAYTATGRESKRRKGCTRCCNLLRLLLVMRVLGARMCQAAGGERCSECLRKAWVWW